MHTHAQRRGKAWDQGYICIHVCTRMCLRTSYSLNASFSSAPTSIDPILSTASDGAGKKHACTCIHVCKISYMYTVHECY